MDDGPTADPAPDHPGAAAHPAAHPAAVAGPPVDWANLGRVLVVRLDNLGDVVMTGPMLRALRAALGPSARLDLLASPAGASVGPLLPGVDETLAWRASWQDAAGDLPLDPARELELVERMTGYDAVIVSTSFSQSPWPAAYAAYLAGVPVRMAQSAEFGGSVLTHWLLPAADDGSAHQVDRALRLVAAGGVPSAGSHLELVRPAGVLPPVGGAYVLLAPGASAPSRRYRGFSEVTALLRSYGLRVLVVGTGKEAALVDDVSGGVDAYPGTLDVPALAAAVAGAEAVIVNNSGCMHLADAYAVPQVALFAGTERLSQYAPRSGAATVFSRPVSCSPCRAFECPYQQECLDVPATQVAAAVLARLANAVGVGRPGRAVRSGTKSAGRRARKRDAA